MFEGFPGAYRAYKAIRVHGRVERPKDTVEELLKAQSSDPGTAPPSASQKKSQEPPAKTPSLKPTPASAQLPPHPKKPPAQ
jgi:hypothetical protein